jgi:hypothetical protein
MSSLGSYLEKPAVTAFKYLILKYSAPCRRITKDAKTSNLLYRLLAESVRKYTETIAMVGMEVLDPSRRNNTRS